METSLLATFRKLQQRSYTRFCRGCVPFKAVLWDMDGTLINTEKLWTLALDDFASQLGYCITYDERRDILGATSEDAIAYIHRRVGYPDTALNRSESKNFLHTRMMALLEDGISWRPGAESILLMLRSAKIPMGLVTNTDRTLTDFILDRIGHDVFNVTICGDEIAQAKPSGAPYLAAASALNILPDHCLVLEDSLIGVQAGSNAGCRVIGIPSEMPLPPSAHWESIPSLNGLALDDLSQLWTQLGD